ncbi:MAG TPA: hypothetical protein VGK36_08780 [Candidatus Angelobacter sp.]|jgi:hypothetical protein
MSNLDKNTKVTRVMNAQAVGTTNVNGSIIDMQGFESVEFIACAGTITDGNFSIKLQDGADPALADAADVAGTLVTAQNTDDNKALVLDISNPVKRYCRVVAVRGGATGAVIDGIIAIQYGARVAPVANDATTVANAETWISPADGTA